MIWQVAFLVLLCLTVLTGSVRFQAWAPGLRSPVAKTRWLTVSTIWSVTVLTELGATGLLDGPIQQLARLVPAVLQNSAITFVLGILATWIARYVFEVRRDATKRREELIAAIRIVRYELAANSAAIDLGIKAQQQKLPFDLTDQNYRSVQLLLSRDLDQGHRLLLYQAYATMPMAQMNLKLQEIRVITPDEAKVLTSTRSQCDTANENLWGLLVNTFRVAE